MNQDEQNQANQEKLGALVMAFMDDLGADFSDAVLGDAVLIAEVFYGGEPDDDYIQRIDAGASSKPDVPRQRSYLKFRATTWRPVVIDGLITGATKVIAADNGEPDDGEGG